MRRRRLILAGLAAAVLIALPAGWYYGSPWWTLWRMREAARAGDLNTLAGYVDSAALGRQAEDEAQAVWGSVLRDVREGKPVDLKALARRHARIEAWVTEIPSRLAGFGRGGDYEAYIVHRGLERFEVRERGTSLETGPMLTFRRHGLGWKLVALRFGQQ